MTIRFRLFATYLGLMVLGAGSLAAVVLWSFERFFLDTTAADLADRAAAIAESVGDYLERGDLDRVAVVARRYGASEAITVRVLDPRGRLIATSQPEQNEWTTDWTVAPGVREAMAGGHAHGEGNALGTHDRRLFQTVPVIRGGRQLGVVRMTRTLAQLEAYTETTVLTVLVALGLILAISALLSALLARGLARPIQRMRNFAVELSRGNFGERLATVRADELGELARELNRMAERLAALEDERRAFLANASHELRTPISNVHVTLEALDSGAADDPDLRARFLRTALEETQRLKRLIQDLLELGRLEAGVTPLARVPLPLAGIAERCARAVEGRALAQRVELRVTADGDPQASVDPERLAQAILNLLDNALKMAPAGSAIQVRVDAAGGHGRISVTDGGPGIEARHLPHVFEQFYRADDSRRRRAGTGLGLAIARRVVEAHGGSLSVASTPGAGATFTVRLPLHAGGAAPPALSGSAAAGAPRRLDRQASSPR